MKKPLRNVAASVRQRLLALAHASGQPNGELLDRYCIERLLYRLSRSPHREQFILKGAMLLTAWGGGVARDKVKQTQWRAFWKKAVRREPMPELPEVVVAISGFLLPAVTAANRPAGFPQKWPGGGPWRAA